MDKDSIRNLKILVDNVVMSSSKKEAKKQMPALENAASLLRADMPSNSYDKLQDVISFASEASGQPRDKLHWVKCVNDSWCAFESSISRSLKGQA